MSGTDDQDRRFLRLSMRIGADAVTAGNHPFGAVLVDGDGKVLGTAMNNYTVDRGPGHAETNLARWAAREFSPEVLKDCTLYSAVEPCTMCAGTVYWAGIGAVVYGLAERRLGEITGDAPENMTLDLECRAVFRSGRRKVEVRGPFPDMEDEIAAQQRDFWGKQG